MNKTVIGAFEIRSEALQAKQDLLAAGFAESAINFHYRDASERSAAGADDNPGFMDAIRSLFTWDLDRYRDEDYAEHYAEAASRGHAILSINVDESEVDRVSDIMDSAGALDIDQKVAEWRGEGYGGGRRSAADEADSSTSTGARSDPVPAAEAASNASSGLDRVTSGTAGGSIGSGAFNTDMDQGSVPGFDERGVSAPPASRRNVHVVSTSNPADRR